MGYTTNLVPTPIHNTGKYTQHLPIKRSTSILKLFINIYICHRSTYSIIYIYIIISYIPYHGFTISGKFSTRVNPQVTHLLTGDNGRKELHLHQQWLIMEGILEALTGHWRRRKGMAWLRNFVRNPRQWGRLISWQGWHWGGLEWFGDVSLKIWGVDGIWLPKQRWKDSE